MITRPFNPRVSRQARAIDSQSDGVIFALSSKGVRSIKEQLMLRSEWLMSGALLNAFSKRRCRLGAGTRPCGPATIPSVPPVYRILRTVFKVACYDVLTGLNFNMIVRSIDLLQAFGSNTGNVYKIVSISIKFQLKSIHLFIYAEF